MIDAAKEFLRDYFYVFSLGYVVSRIFADSR